LIATLAATASLAVVGAGSVAAGPALATTVGPAATVAAAPASGAISNGVAHSGDLQTLRAKHTNGGPVYQGSATGRSAPSLRAGANLVATADIRVIYRPGFSAAAQSAFQAAVDIWKTQVRSSVPITINATWTSLGTDVLGQAGPVDFRRDFVGASRPGTYYPDALANSMARRDLDPAQPEIQARFNSTFGSWYLGTDGRPDSNSYDFESVVLHELGHGLGFVGTFDGLTPPSWTDARRGYWGLDGPGDRPTIFDRLVVDGFGRDALDTGAYPQGSLALGGLLRGSAGGAQWKGAEGVLGASGARPKLYSPAGFEEGSSVSHLAESAYAPGSADALMTPYLQNGESAHDPGPIVRGMFQDMGWGSAATCARATGSTTDRFLPQAVTRRGTVAMTGGVTFDLPMTGRAGLPSTGVDAVLATIEIPKPSANGYLMVGSGCGGATASAQQYSAGVSRSALVSVPLDSLGRMQLRLSSGAAKVSVDVHGWYASTGTPTGLFHAVPRTRASGAVIPASAPRDVAITGVGGVPASGVDAVLLNLTVVTPTASGDLFAGPGGVTPTVSEQSYSAGRSISQLVVARRSADGKVRIALSAGSAAVLVDVWGYYGSDGDVAHRVVPTRVLNGSTAPDVTFTVPGLPADTHSVVLVTTVVGPTANGYLSAGAGDGSAALPGVVQYYRGDSVANLVVLPVAPGNRVRLKLNAGTGRLYADLLGYHAAT
jgi:hypothetical protein